MRQKITEMECYLKNNTNKTIGDTPFHVLYGYYLSITDKILCHAITENNNYEDVNALQQILEEHKLWTEKHSLSNGKPIQYEV